MILQKSLVTRYEHLKKQVGGNREKLQFEHTMGPTAAERAHITPMNKDNLRILSEIHFALGLSARFEGKYDACIDGALAVLEQAMAEEGVITRSMAARAEAFLLPLHGDAKEYTVLYAAHAHIDMNWMWGWQETVAVTLSTFRTILNLMKEYPEFTYSQSQASVYRIVEEYDPDMMEEIKSRIAEGRWEVTANAWVETDKNMPDTESLIRHIALTRKYLQEVWGVNPQDLKVDFSPDTFGHSRFVPEINQFGGVPYYYHCRGLQQELTLYRYRAPSGRELLMYKEPYWYNSGVNPDNGTGVFELERRCGGLKTSLIVYGVGNHGGGPTRRDIEMILEMQKWPIFPTLRFGTIREYFEKAEAVRENVPVVDHELNAIFTGCYTTQSRIKLANRRAETALLESETMNALANVKAGGKLAEARFEQAWQKTLFTHFHDILTGSGVQETREYAMGKLADAIACAQSEQTKAYEKLSQAVDTSMFDADEDIADTRSEGAGVGFGIGSYAGVPNPERGAGKTRIFTVFNPSAKPRRELVELTVWDYAGDLQRLEAVDHLGNRVPMQLVDSEPLSYWDHLYARVLIMADVPAMGYATYALQEKVLTEYPTHLLHAEREELPKDDIVLENKHLCAHFDTGSGMMLSLVDKSSGAELLSGPAGLYLVRTENAGMTAWRIGRYLGIEPVVGTNKVSIVEGKLRSSVTFEQRAMHSTVSVTVSLDEDATALCYDLKVDWHETCGAQSFIPVLSYRLPLKQSAQEIICDVPAGSVRRASRQLDVPALTGAYGVSDSVTAALITDCKYGYRLADGVLSVTLINTSGDPDPYPERGIHAIKLFVALTDGNAAAYKAKARALISPLTGVPTARHAGALTPKGSLMEIDTEHCVVSSIQALEDALLVRLYETDGAEDSVVIHAPFAPKRAERTKLDGTVVSEVTVKGQDTAFCVPPYTIVQIRLVR